MREAKGKQLKKEIEILSQTFERIVDRSVSPPSDTSYLHENTFTIIIETGYVY